MYVTIVTLRNAIINQGSMVHPNSTCMCLVMDTADKLKS